MTNRGTGALDAVIVFDVGTTHLKWAMAEMTSEDIVWRGQELVHTSLVGLASEQDPLQIWHLLQSVLHKARDYGMVRRIALSAAMHSFLAVDHRGQPLTHSWTWMDKRAADVAQRLRHSPAGANLRRLSGVPVHSMSPLLKWLSIQGGLPQDACPIALKDYLIYQLTGQWQTDYSTASASGFLGLDGRWLTAALDVARLDASRLPVVGFMTDRLVTRDGRAEVLIGGTDAAMAHYHLRIPPDGSVAVLAMGTSGAIRVTSRNSVEDEALFCYTLGPGAGCLVGSAFSNMGNAIQWLADLFGMTVDSVIERGIGAIRSGRKLPHALPYWQGERSPWWHETLTGTWSEMGPETTAADLIGATLIAITASYWDGLRTLRRVGQPVQEIRAGPGMMTNPIMGQWMADALSQDIVLYDQQDASLLGALDFAMERVPEAPTEVHRLRAQFPVEDRMAQVWSAIQAAVHKTVHPL